MKSNRIALSLILLATTAAFAQSTAQKSFDQLKALNGTWEGKTRSGQTAPGFFSRYRRRLGSDE